MTGAWTNGSRIRKSTIYVGGRLTGVSHELVKNLALKGVGKIVLFSWPQCELPADYVAASVLFQVERAEDERLCNAKMGETMVRQAAALNPSVELSFVRLEDASELARHLNKDVSILVLINERSPRAAQAVDAMCRQVKVPFEWIITEDLQSMMINDFGDHYEYTNEVKKNVEGETVTETSSHSLAYIPVAELWRKHGEMAVPRNRNKRKATVAAYSDQFRTWQSRLEEEDVANANIAENASVNAIVGAVSAQEVIKVVTGRDLPIHNVLLFNGDALESTIISIT